MDIVIKGIIWGLHAVEPDSHRTEVSGLYRALTVSPYFLESLILSARTRGYQFVSMRQFLHDKQDGEEHKHIVITIDDGWKSICQYAYPIFQKHQVPFVFYVATDLIENGFKNCTLPEMDGIHILCDRIHQSSGTHDEKRRLFKKMWNRYKYRRRFFFWENGHRIMQSLFPDAPLDFDAYKRHAVCSPTELKEMVDSGLCELGSHSHTHVHLDRISARNVKRECLLSQQKVTGWTGKQCVHFSYPYGHADEHAQKTIKDYFESAVIIYRPDRTDNRRHTLSTDSPYELPRIFVDMNSTLEDLLPV